jgi:excisionase family DNA binding protein
MKSGMSRWLDTCKRKQHPGVAAFSPLAPDEVGLPFLSRFGSLFPTLIERCEYVSLNVLQNLLSAKLALHVTAVLATTRKMNRLPRVYIVLLQNGADRCNHLGGLSAATILTLIDSERQRLCFGALPVVLPAAAVRLLGALLAELAKGNAVTLMPHHAELTTQEVADLLVSRPFLIGLLENGQLPHQKVGTHPRVRFADLMTYERRRDAEGEEALRELAALSQE